MPKLVYKYLIALFIITYYWGFMMACLDDFSLSSDECNKSDQIIRLSHYNSYYISALACFLISAILFSPIILIFIKKKLFADKYDRIFSVSIIMIPTIVIFPYMKKLNIFINKYFNNLSLSINFFVFLIFFLIPLFILCLNSKKNYID